MYLIHTYDCVISMNTLHCVHTILMYKASNGSLLLFIMKILMSMKTMILVTILMVLYVTTLSEAMSVLVHLATPCAMSRMNASVS